MAIQRSAPRRPPRARELPDKARVHAALRASLEQALEAMARAAEETRKGATHEESRSEGDKDMRATEQSYVARGQAMRTEQLAEELARFVAEPIRGFDADARIAVGALVRARVDDEPRVFFVCPQGGGSELLVDERRVTVLTPSSPAGRAILGKRAGDAYEVEIGPRTRSWEIERVG